MKIIQIVPMFAMGGGEVMCEKLIYELKKMGHEIIAVSMYNYHSAITERLESNGVRIEYLNKNPGFNFRLFMDFYRLLKKEKPDVVHNHLYSLKYVMPGAILNRIPVKVHTVHSVASKEITGLSKLVHKILFKYFNVVPVGLTRLIKESVVKEYGISDDKVSYILNGMPVEEYKNKTDYSIVKTILHIGRFQTVKNHRGLIEAFETIHKKYPDIMLNLVGEGCLEDEIKVIVSEKNLDNVVHFKGLLADVRQELNKADIFCLPSNYEGMPMTIIEPMASGLPVVATAVGGVPDMITDGKDGVLCNNTPEDVALALEKVIQSAELREKLGKNALDTSKAYSSENMAKKYYNLYCKNMKK